MARYHFGDFVLDTDRHELFRGCELIAIRPKVFQLLSYLVANGGRMVPKAELLETIWPSSVGDEVLNSCVMAARRVVGDDGKAQGVIKTIHGLGYRFVAPVREHPDGLDDETSEIAVMIPEPTAQNVIDNRAADFPAENSVPDAEVTQLPSNESKTVTVLACRVDQAKMQADLIGPEAMHDHMETFFENTRKIMNRHEGSIVQWLDDGFLALFGAPVTHDDDARRAALAALELNQILNERNPSSTDQSLTADLSASMGLHTGLVVVGRIRRARELRTYTAPGKTTDLALRLQSVAAPGAVLVSENTFRLIETEVDAEPQDAHADAPPCFRLLGVAKRRAGVPWRRRHKVDHFVGRREELAILRERLTRLDAKDSQIVALSADAGIGKSRLLSEFCGDLSSTENRILTGQCLPYGADTPYLPIIGLVRQLIEIGSSRNEPQIKSKIRAYTERKSILPDTESLLFELLGVSNDKEARERTSPQARRTQMFAFLEELFFAASLDRPLVVVIEDLHWIDATSEEWLEGFVGRLAQAAILLLVTYRPPYRPDWIGRSPATQLALPPLSLEDSTILVRSMMKGIDARREVTDNLIAKAAGNPFFLEELTYSLGAEPDGPHVMQVPDTVQAVLTSRIDRLDPVCKQLLQTCSVIGTPILHDALGHISDLDADALALGLDMLEDEGFLVRTRVASETVLSFKHALTQEATYQSLPSGRRAIFHSHIAQVLERHFYFITTNQPELLAQHYTKAGNAGAALPYWQRASRSAFERSANIEAIHYSNEGLRLLENSDIENERSETELSLQLSLAPALMAAKGYGAPEVEPVYARARMLCEKIGDDGQLFRTLIGSWNFYWVRGELSTGRDVASQLLDLAERAEDPVRELRAHAAMGEIMFHSGELRASLDHLRQGIAVHKATPKDSLAAKIPEVVCLCYAAWAEWHLGYSQESRTRADEAIALATELSHPMSLALCLSLNAALHQFRLEVPECLDVAQQAVALSREQKLPFWEGTAMVVLGWAQAMDGDTETGTHTLKNGLEIFVGTGARIQRAAWLGMLAEVYSLGGQFDEALHTVREAQTWVGQIQEEYYHPELLRLEGQILWNLDSKANAEAAKNAFQSAIEVARKQGAIPREMRATVGLAQMLTEQGQRVEALTLMKPLQHWIGDAGDSLDARNACMLIDTLI